MTFIRYRGMTAAVCDLGRVILAAEIENGPPEERRFVLAMCQYALLIQEDELPGPFDQADAESFAREVVLPDHEFVALAGLPAGYLATAFDAPLAEVQNKRREIAAISEFGSPRWG